MKAAIALLTLASFGATFAVAQPQTDSTAQTDSKSKKSNKKSKKHKKGEPATDTAAPAK